MSGERQGYKVTVPLIVDLPKLEASEADERKLLWQAVQAYVADTPAPPSDFVVKRQKSMLTLPRA